MKITKTYLKQIIKEEIDAIKERVKKDEGENLKYNIDKTDMYSSGAYPAVELTIKSYNPQVISEIFNLIKQNKVLQKISSWKSNEEEIYTQILFNNVPVSQRYGILNNILNRVDKELNNYGIIRGFVKEPKHEDY
jgi:hypothetical protein